MSLPETERGYEDYLEYMRGLSDWQEQCEIQDSLSASTANSEPASSPGLPQPSVSHPTLPTRGPWEPGMDQFVTATNYIFEVKSSGEKPGLKTVTYY